MVAKRKATDKWPEQNRQHQRDYRERQRNKIQELEDRVAQLGRDLEAARAVTYTTPISSQTPVAYPGLINGGLLRADNLEPALAELNADDRSSLQLLEEMRNRLAKAEAENKVLKEMLKQVPPVPLSNSLADQALPTASLQLDILPYRESHDTAWNELLNLDGSDGEDNEEENRITTQSTSTANLATNTNLNPLSQGLDMSGTILELKCVPSLAGADSLIDAFRECIQTGGSIDPALFLQNTTRCKINLLDACKTTQDKERVLGILDRGRKRNVDFMSQVIENVKNLSVNEHSEILDPLSQVTMDTFKASETPEAFFESVHEIELEYSKVRRMV
ncbi:UNVERIFIED_CONTAM: hypothetical protein HDU68_001710 [Siphonaria sp. JEL0065]|nr:hypothetical protein HDU68_001710 [Siphonaria sp. JEL0065]